jgi:hypothetical protein
MKSFPRADRVAAQIHKVLSEVLAKKIKDPRLEMAVVTGVKMSRDIKTAIVYYSVSGDENTKAQVWPKASRRPGGSSNGPWPAGWGCGICRRLNSFMTSRSNTVQILTA